MEDHKKIQDKLLYITAKAENGDMSFIEALSQMRFHRYQLKLANDIISSFEVDFWEQIVDEISNYDGDYNGYHYEVRNGGRSFSYKQIPEWVELENKKKEIEEKYKSYFVAKEKGMLNVTDDGVEIVLPEVSYRKSSIVQKKL